MKPIGRGEWIRESPPEQRIARLRAEHGSETPYRWLHGGYITRIEEATAALLIAANADGYW